MSLHPRVLSQAAVFNAFIGQELPVPAG